MIFWLQRLGQQGVSNIARIGQSGIYLLNILWQAPKWRSIPMVMNEIYHLGIMSLLIVVVSGLFIGMVLSLQGYNILKDFGSVDQLGQMVALSVLRELGPVITGLLFAGRAGSSLTAEIGLMKTTEQFASMEMMAVNPIWRIVMPRFWAGIISMPILALIFSLIAIYGGYMVGVEWLSIDKGTFWINIQEAVHFRWDVLNGIIKSVVFGFVVTWIALYQGYYTVPTAEGMSYATTKTVVYSSLAVLGLDFVLTAIMLKGW